MDKDIPLHPQEIIFSSSNTAISRKIAGLEKEGKLRKLAPRIYSPNLQEPAEDLIRRNLFKIIGRLYPDIVLSHRSAFEYKPTVSGNLFLTSTYLRNVELPVLTKTQENLKRRITRQGIHYSWIISSSAALSLPASTFIGP